MFFDRGFLILTYAVAIVLTPAACQPIPSITVAEEAEPPPYGEQIGSANSLLDQDTSSTTLAKLEWMSKRLEETRVVDPNFDRIIAAAPNHANAYFGRGSAYAALGDFDRAIQDFDKAIQLDPNHALAYFNRGVVRASLGDFGQAVQDLEASLEIDPDASYVPQAREMLAELYTQKE